MKIAIAGAGIIGQLVALSLLNAGHEISLFDHGHKNNASHAAAGLLTPVAELPTSDWLIFCLGIAAIQQYWPAILQQLAVDIYFQATGSLVLAHRRDQAELCHWIQHMAHKKPAQASHALYQALNQTQLQTLEPEIAHFTQGYFLPLEAQLDSQNLLTALQAYLVKQGASWQEDTVHKVAPGEICLSTGTLTFDSVIDCRGLGAKALFPRLRSVRGELLWLHAPTINLSRPIRFFHPRYRIYLAPRPGKIYILGASEIESEDNSPICVRSTLQLLTAAYSVNPRFDEARILNTVTQCRPTLPDHLPQIKYKDGLIAINGLFRHGFLIGPSLAAEVQRFFTHGYTALSYPELWSKIT